MLGVFDQIQVDVFADVFKIQRAVGVRLDIAFGAFDFFPGCEVFHINFVWGIGVFNSVPHFKKHQCERAHGGAFEADAGVLPIAVGMGDVEIFVGEVVAARVGHLSVDDREFAVITVVHENIEQRNHRVEIPALDPVASHALDETLIDEADAADVVVEQTHLDAFLDLLPQNVIDAGKSLSVLNGKVLHKDKMLGAAQIIFHRVEGFVGQIEKLNGCVVVNRVGAAMTDVMADIGQRRLRVAKLIGDSGVLCHHWIEQFIDGRVAFAHAFGDVDASAEGVEQKSEFWKQ